MSYLVSVIGAPGVGKTTAIEAVKTVLADQEPAVVHYRKTGAGIEMDERLKDAARRMTPAAALARVIQTNAYVMQEHVMPALDQARPVIMDRDYHCIIANYGAGYELGQAYVEDRLALAGLMSVLPNRIFLLDAPIEVAQQRKLSRADQRPRLHDDAPYDALVRTRFNYLRQALDQDRPESGRFHLIDSAEKDASEVAKEIGKVITDDLLKLEK